MNCDFPWSAELWEAESASAFSRIAKANPTKNPLPPLKEVITQLLDTPTNGNPIPWGPSLSSEHLLILIYGEITSFFNNYSQNTNTIFSYQLSSISGPRWLVEISSLRCH